MANTLITPTRVIKEVGRRLVNKPKFANTVNRGYDDQFKGAGGKQGYTVNARLPQRYTVNKGPALNPQSVTDATVPITLTDQANVGIEFSMISLTMEVDDYRERYIDPAVETLVNTCDFDGLSRCYKSVNKSVGTPGVTAGSTGTLPGAANNVYMLGVTKLVEGAVPKPYTAILTANMHQYLVSANSALFNPSAAISAQYKTGQFGSMALGVDNWFMDENIATHTVGALGGTPLTNISTAVAEGATTLITDGWTAAAAVRMKDGDVFQVGGVYEVNPQNLQSTGRLMDFVCTGDQSSDSSGNLTISFTPAMRSTGAFANVNALPIDGAAITVFGHASTYANAVSRQGLMYHKDAFVMVMADLEVPGGVWVAQRISNKALGIAVRFVKDYNIMTDQSPARLDILYGWKTVRPEMACRIQS